MSEHTSSFSRLLAEGDLRSDGFANDVAATILQNPILLPELIETLSVPDPHIRGHAAHAVEIVARSLPQDLVVSLPAITRSARHDEIPMVRWHMAMVLGHLLAIPNVRSDAGSILLSMLEDKSPFVLCWAISSLCILARLEPAAADSILPHLEQLIRHASVSVSGRAKTAIQIITNPAKRFPCGWVKSEHIRL